MNRDDEAETDTPLAQGLVPIANEADGLATAQALEPHRSEQVTALHVVGALFDSAVAIATSAIASRLRSSGHLMRSLAGAWSMKSGTNAPSPKPSPMKPGGAV